MTIPDAVQGTKKMMQISEANVAPQVPLVSIGIPTYNRPDELARALKNIAAQDYPNIEIIVSDNHSSDARVQQVLETFGAKDARLRTCLKTCNEGAPANFLTVLEMAKGEYFMWTADDDMLDSSFASTAVTALQENPQYTLWAATIKNVDNDGNTVKLYPGFSRFNAESQIATIWRFVSEPEIMGKANIIYGMYRREALLAYMRQTPLRDRWASDVTFMYGMLCRYRALFSDAVLLSKTVPEAIVRSRSHENTPLCKSIKIKNYFYLVYWQFVDGKGLANHLVMLSAMTWRLIRPLVYKVLGKCR